MRVLITGGAGFLGRRLARALLDRGRLAGPDGSPRPIERLVLLDLAPAEGLDDPRVEVATGDLADEALLRRALGDASSVFHLAAVVSAQAEADLDLGMRVNLDGTRALLDACRRLRRPPRLVSTSSVAVYGGGVPPEGPTDDTALRPRSSYGAQKAIGELLVADYSRRGHVDGRVLRLPTVTVRPGKPNRAASAFASGIIREPLSGLDAACPVSPDTRVWVLSPRRAVEALVLGHELPAAALGEVRSVNLPGLSVTVAEMVQALVEVAGPAAAARIRWEPDPVVQRIVGSWPARWDVARAERLGFAGDPDFTGIVRAYVEDDLPRAMQGP